MGGQAHEININSRWLVRCSENHQTLGSEVNVPSPSQGSRAAPKIAARRPLSGRTPSDSLSTHALSSSTPTCSFLSRKDAKLSP